MKPFLQGRGPVSIRMPSRRKSVIVRLTVLSPSSVWRWIVPLEHQTPEPSSLALSARNMMICLRAALPKIRPAQRLAIYQLMRGSPGRGSAGASMATDHDA